MSKHVLFGQDRNIMKCTDYHNNDIIQKKKTSSMDLKRFTSSENKKRNNNLISDCGQWFTSFFVQKQMVHEFKTEKSKLKVLK